MDMKERLQELAEAAGKRISESEGLEKLNEVRVAYLGKKGELTAILKSMKDVAPEERPKVGQLVNETRSKIEALLDESKQKLEEAAREEKMKQEVIDVTLPAKKAKIGHRHPNTIALEEVERIFIGMGYEVVEGPEVEYADYNFTKLNIPENHPARDEQDTFFINDSILLRSQTSPVQARTMEKGRTSLLQILRELCRSLHRNYSDLRQKLSSDHITSRSQSQAQRWMYPVSSVVVKAAVSVKVPAGLKSLAAVWFIRMY